MPLTGLVIINLRSLLALQALSVHSGTYIRTLEIAQTLLGKSHSLVSRWVDV